MSDPIYTAQSLWDLLERRVEATPDHPMLFDTSERILTFSEVKQYAERTAAGLMDLGVTADTPVTWILPTRIETVVISLALSRLGAIQNPIIHIYRDREVGFCIKQTRAEYVLTQGEWEGFDYTAMVRRVTESLVDQPITLAIDTKFPVGDPDSLPPVSKKLSEPIRWIYYTSGTTADPKGVMHSDLSLIAGGIGLARALDMQPNDVGSIAFPYAHIGGPDYLVCLLVSGFPAVLVERFQLAPTIEAYRRLGVTMAGGSTVFYTMFLNAQRQNPGEPLIPTLRLLSGGGAPKPPEIFFEVKSEMGMPIAHGYGMTESPMICQGSPHDSEEQLANTEGAPVFGARVAVVSPDGSVCQPGEEGEVVVSGPQLFKGYKDPLLDVEAFDSAGRFLTGDLGIMREDGHLSLTGRVKEIIVRKGENISPREIEDVLFTHTSVNAVAVVGITDTERGERV